MSKFHKGQFRIVSELVLFGVGILITSFVIVNFNGVQENVKSISIYDQMDSIADTVSMAVVKVANSGNASVRLRIPNKISDSTYRISIKDADGGKIVITTMDGKVSVERQLFNINYDNIDYRNGVINNSEVVSAAEFVEILKNEKITIRRVSLRT